MWRSLHTVLSQFQLITEVKFSQALLLAALISFGFLVLSKIVEHFLYYVVCRSISDCMVLSVSSSEFISMHTTG